MYSHTETYDPYNPDGTINTPHKIENIDLTKTPDVRRGFDATRA